MKILLSNGQAEELKKSGVKYLTTTSKALSGPAQGELSDRVVFMAGFG